MAEERVVPIHVTDSETGEVYELDFNRDSIRFAEKREFVMEDILKYPTTKIPELFFYAFRKNHRNIARDKTDALLEKMGGLPSSALERLIQLYRQAAYANIVVLDDEEETKNGTVTLEL